MENNQEKTNAQRRCEIVLNKYENKEDAFKELRERLGILEPRLTSIYKGEQIAAYEETRVIKSILSKGNLAKKILFGRTDIGDNPEAKMNEKALRRKYDKNVFPNAQKPPASTKPVASGEPEEIDLGDSTSEELVKLFAYCVEQNISIEQLIEAHKALNQFRETTNEALKRIKIEP